MGSEVREIPYVNRKSPNLKDERETREEFA